MEPSAISTSSVEGPTHDTRTVHDSGPKHGRSSPGHRTIRDIGTNRGWFNTWIPHCPRHGALTWKAQPWTSNRPRYRPSAWKVQHLIPELSMIQALSVEGSRLDTEPSAILTFSVEGSTLEPRTVREMGHQHGRLGLGEWNRPRYGALTWKVQP